MDAKDNDTKMFMSQMLCDEHLEEPGDEPEGGSSESGSYSDDEAPRPMVRSQAVIIRGPARPDLRAYFATYNTDPTAQVQCCRTYANWLSAEIRAQTGTAPAPVRSAAPGTRPRVSWAHGGTYKKRRETTEYDRE